eukprot:TRINITY_DN6812_c0_g1_i1.p1 TRINITY_DN6812_c0_g1~~TRINITY_DN6812_c0_g1_i1.p1  ORF type:complete len:498 (+),score=101.60 TRINITY_DN6812_c0_g1_i1:57-1550(+)
MRKLYLLSLCISLVLVVSALPSDFKWGVATASYQIEGAYDQDGRGLSIWDFYSHTPGKVANGDNGDVADNSYNLYETDITLMKELGVDTYRFSISWSRIFPNGREPINEAGVKHYNDLIDALLANNITPFVTLYHWDLPLDLEWNLVGWLNASIVDAYTLYAETCFSRFGDRVKHWLTFNEPLTFTNQGYGTGTNAPGRCSDRKICAFGDSSTEPYIAGHNVLLSHAKAVQIYRQKYQKEQKGEIGITVDCTWGEPLTSDFADQAAAERYLEFQVGWWADPIFFGDYPNTMKQRIGNRLPLFTSEQKAMLKGSHDFFGLNHYTARYVSQPASPPEQKGWQYDQDTSLSTTNSKGEPIGPQADSSWLYVVPWGFRKTLNWVDKRYGNPKIYVTENGVDVPKESELPIEEAINDIFRVDFLSNYTHEMELAVEEDNVNVVGYMVWSLLDNFEWADGFTKRFGIHYVDYTSKDLKRYSNKSSEWYKNFIEKQKAKQKIQK